ncbi:hypothetical protein [Paenibacillus oleatilyticus]|uniref:Uncharacterized protein n=1 Tax=Paenibacillus oleatilyticus TaxID=2594886 RepID=A0ABV4V5D3_9BACL
MFIRIYYYTARRQVVQIAVRGGRLRNGLRLEEIMGEGAAGPVPVDIKKRSSWTAQINKLA